MLNNPKNTPPFSTPGNSTKKVTTLPRPVRRGKQVEQPATSEVAEVPELETKVSPILETPESPSYEPSCNPDHLPQYFDAFAIPERPDMPEDYEAKYLAFRAKLEDINAANENYDALRNDAILSLTADGIRDPVELWQRAERLAWQELTRMLTPTPVLQGSLHQRQMNEARSSLISYLTK